MLIIVILAITIWYFYRVVEKRRITFIDNPNDATFIVDVDNERINSAKEEARKTIDYFVGILNSDEANDCLFSVKVKIDDGEQVEFVWLSDIEYLNGKFKGKIANEIQSVKNVKEGDIWEVDKESISDWLYVKDDKLYGNFTCKAAISGFPLEKQLEMLENYGDIDELFILSLKWCVLYLRVKNGL